MNFLRNPWVTGALAIVAGVVVYFQVFAPQSRSPGSAPKSPPPSASPGPQNAPAPAPTRPNPLALAALAATNGRADASEFRMDRAYLESRFPRWVNAPERDPFLVIAPEPALKNLVPTNSPVASWKLTGLYQTVGHLAVLNNKVYAEGDEIEGYRIEKIDGDEVWLRGTNGLERLGLLRHRSAVKAPPAQAPRPK
jgi:hypothetical protein